MTIQVADITHLGIVMAADGAISYSDNGNIIFDGTRKPEDWRRQKLFEIPNLRAGIGYFGLAQVYGKPMEDWLGRFIHTNKDAKTAKEFAHRLANTLQNTITTAESKEKSGFHIGSYRYSDGENIPEMHVVRNYDEDKSGTPIMIPNRGFEVKEHISLNYGTGYKCKAFEDSLFFQNGYKKIYNVFSQPIMAAFKNHIWPDHEFMNPPKTIREWARTTEFRLYVVRLFFEKFYSIKGQQPVGGLLRFLAIPSDPAYRIEEWTSGRNLWKHYNAIGSQI